MSSGRTSPGNQQTSFRPPSRNEITGISRKPPPQNRRQLVTSWRSQERYRNPKPGRSKIQPQRTREFTEDECYNEGSEHFEDGEYYEEPDMPYERLDLPPERMDLPSERMDLPSGRMGSSDSMELPSESMEEPSEGMDVPAERIALPEKVDDKLAEAKHTESHESEYKVFIDMTDEEGLGLMLRKSANKFIVTEVVEGPVKAWNSSNPESQRVRAMDELVCLYVEDEQWSLDDIDQHQRITNELGLSCIPNVKLKMRRPSEVTIQLSKKGRDLGMFVRKRIGDHDISVVGLEHGAILDWNRDNPDQRLECGDLIFIVNQCEGNPREMGNLLRDCERLEIIAWHYGTDQSMDYGTDQSIPS